MANYENLKNAIRSSIKENGREEITGQIMQDALIATINAFGNGYIFKGLATPETNPGYPDAKEFYLATEPGDYAHMGAGYDVEPGELAMFIYSDEWEKITITDKIPIIVECFRQEIDGVFYFRPLAGELTLTEIAELVIGGKTVYLKEGTFLTNVISANWAGAGGYFLTYMCFAEDFETPELRIHNF